MPSSATTAPTLIEAAVLGLLAEQPQHGFELARVLERDGWLGTVFTARRPVVYRALKTLEQKGMVAGQRTESSGQGPERTIVAVTPAGRDCVFGWLGTPVRHMRDVRIELLVKLALREHLGLDIRPFIATQIDHFRPIHRALHTSPVPANGVERHSLLWRREASDAVMRFLDELHTP